MIDFAKQNPGKLFNASSGNGTPGHVGFELFKYMTGTQIVHVPYKGGAAAIGDLIAGQVQVMLESTNSITPFVKAGRVRGLGVTGEVLFMDQRQLLTFGQIRDIPFVPEYEKKVLMNDALGGATRRFRSLYADLAAKRFSLILTEPLRAPIKDSTYQFGEENNAWVTWVSGPVLCFYEPLNTLKKVTVQLLVPRQDVSG